MNSACKANVLIDSRQLLFNAKRSTVTVASEGLSANLLYDKL